MAAKLHLLVCALNCAESALSYFNLFGLNIALFSTELFSKRTVPYFLIPGPPDDVAIRANYFWFFIQSKFMDPIILITFFTFTVPFGTVIISHRTYTYHFSKKNKHGLCRRPCPVCGVSPWPHPVLSSNGPESKLVYQCCLQSTITQWAVAGFPPHCHLLGGAPVAIHRNSL